MVRNGFFIVIALAGLVDLSLAESKKLRNPMKRRSLEQNLRLLEKMKRRFPVVNAPTYRARMKLGSKKKPSTDSANPIPTVAPTSTPRPTIRPTSTPLPTIVPTSTPLPTLEPTKTPQPTATRVPSFTPTSVPKPKVKPTRKPKPKPKPRPKKVKRKKVKPKKVKLKKVVPKIVPTVAPTPDVRAAAARLRAMFEQEKVDTNTTTKYALAIRLAEAVIWPKDYFASQANFVFCGLSPDVPAKMIRSIEQIELHGKKLKYRNNPQKLRDCHALLVDDTNRLEEVLRSLATKHLLTIGVGKSYRKSGVNLSLYKIDDGAVGLALDKQSLERIGLRPSAKLIQLAQDVY